MTDGSVPDTACAATSGLQLVLAERGGAAPLLRRLPGCTGVVAGATLRQRCGPGRRAGEILFMPQAASRAGRGGGAADLLRSTAATARFGTTCC